MYEENNATDVKISRFLILFFFCIQGIHTIWNIKPSKADVRLIYTCLDLQPKVYWQLQLNE